MYVCNKDFSDNCKQQVFELNVSQVYAVLWGKMTNPNN